MSTGPTYFTTEEADEIFMNDFVMGTSGLIQAEILKANDLYDNLGELWFNTEQKLSGLKGEPAHEPTEDSSLVEDVRFAVEHTLTQLWDTEPPVTKGRSLAGRRVPLKMSAIAASYSKHATKALAPKVEPPVAAAATEQQPAGSFLDQLVAKMNGTPSGTPNGNPLPTIPEETPAFESGNGQGPRPRAPQVSPQLTHAAARLLNPGPPPLRNPERWGTSIALHILQEKSSITDWVAALNLSGHNNREARTLARALELGVSEFGATYFGSKSAEVQLRRLLAIMVAAASGSTAEAWRGASQLEDLPGDGIGANLPAVVQKSPRESFKLEYQLEALLAGKMPDKGEKNKK